MEFQLPCVTTPWLSLLPDISPDQVELHPTLAAVMSLVKLGKPNGIAFSGAIWSSGIMGKSMENPQQDASNRYSTWYFVPWLRLEHHPDISDSSMIFAALKLRFWRGFLSTNMVNQTRPLVPGLFKIPEPPARFGANDLLNSKGSYFVLKIYENIIKYLKIA